MNALFFAISNLIDIYLILKFFKLHNMLKISKFYKLIIFMLICITTIINLFEIKTLNFIVFFLMTILLSMTVFKNDIKTSFFLAIVYNIIGSISEIISYFCINSVYNEFLDTSLGMIIFILFNCTLKVIFIFAYSPFKNLFSQKIFFKSLLPIMIVPVSYIVFIFSIIKDFDSINRYVKMSAAVLFFSNFIILYIMYKVNESERLNIELKEAKTREKLNEVYYELISQKYNTNKRYVHDFNKHINVLNSLLLNNDYDQMKDYLQSMFKASARLSNQNSCGNKILDLVLGNINGQFDTCKIKFIFNEIQDLDLKYIYLYDLIAILYNVLENAVESCYEEGGFIDITFKQNEINYIILKIRNTANKKNIYFMESTKNNQEMHGLGIKNIESTVRTLRGFSKFKYIESEKEFISTIILPHYAM